MKDRYIMKRGTVVLTGVTGYLGSRLAIYLMEKGYDVIGLKRVTSSLDNLKKMSAPMTLHNVEEVDIDELFSRYPNVSCVIHTATNYGRSGDSVSDIFQANTEFPLKLMDAASRHKVPIFINTDTILDKYLNLYSFSKSQLLDWGRFFVKHGRISFCNVKLEHFYGPFDDVSKFTGYVVDSCKRNINQLDLTLGYQKRDFVYIDDVLSAFHLILTHSDEWLNSFKEFEVGSGKAISIRSFVEMVKVKTSSLTKLNFGALTYRQGEIMESVADITALRRLGWKCEYDIECGLDKLLKVERANL